MTRSANGWPAGTRTQAHIVTRRVPGTKVDLPVNADAAGLLIWAATQWHRRVEPLHAGWCWGWANRDIRGSSTVMSNHASGTAIDLNAPKHPRGVPSSRNLSAAQIREIHQILREANKVHRVLTWGGDYSRAQVDAMHIEVADRATVREVAAAAHRLTHAAPKPTAKKPAPKPTIKELLQMDLADKITVPKNHQSNSTYGSARPKDEQVSVESLLIRIYTWTHVAAYGKK